MHHSGYNAWLIGCWAWAEVRALQSTALVLRLLYLPNKSRMSWVQVCLLPPQSSWWKQKSFQPNRCSEDIVCMTVCAARCRIVIERETVWALLPSPGTSGMFALSGASLTHLFILSALFAHSLQHCGVFFIATLNQQFAKCFNFLAKQLEIFQFPKAMLREKEASLCWTSCRGWVRKMSRPRWNVLWLLLFNTSRKKQLLIEISDNRLWFSSFFSNSNFAPPAQIVS